MLFILQLTLKHAFQFCSTSIILKSSNLLMMTELQKFPPCEAIFKGWFCSTCRADSESVSEWVDISLPTAQDVGLTLRRCIDAVKRLPIIRVQVNASLSLQIAPLMRSKVGLSHTACYGTTKVKLAVRPTLLARGFGVSLAQCDTVIRMKNKETLSHITH